MNTLKYLLASLMLLRPYVLIDRLIADNFDEVLRLWPLDDY